MNWRHKHFFGEQTYTQPRDQVLKEARAFMAEAARWKIEETDEGFIASGIDFGHVANATFQLTPSDDAIRLNVDLAVKRRGIEGFMLFDIGGYYGGEIRHWLQGIGDRLDGRVGALAPHCAPRARARMFGCLVGFGVVAASLLLLWTFVLGPIIGLAFGVLVLLGRNGDSTLHGTWARGVSAAIIAVDVLFYLRWRRWSRRAR